MSKVYEKETDYGKMRVVESVYNYDGIIDKAWRLYDIYETGKCGMFRVNESIVSEGYAKRVIEKYGLKLVK